MFRIKSRFLSYSYSANGDKIDTYVTITEFEAHRHLTVVRPETLNKVNEYEEKKNKSLVYIMSTDNHSQHC